MHTIASHSKNQSETYTASKPSVDKIVNHKIEFYDLNSINIGFNGINFGISGFSFKTEVVLLF